MPTFSKPSSLISSIVVPKVTNFNSSFTYNFYVDDESVNQESGIPQYLKIKSPDQVTTEITSTALRLPRYITLSWNPPAIPDKQTNQGIKENISKIATESFYGKFFPYSFSSKESIAYANIDINQNLDNTSQATTIDSYVNDLLKDYAETGDQAGLKSLQDNITNIVSSIEALADNPGEAFGVVFYDNAGDPITNYAGFDRLIATSEGVKVQINSAVLPDLFLSASLSEGNVAKMNSFYTSAINNFQNFPFLQSTVDAVEVGSVVPTNFIESKIYFIGYIIDRFEILPTGPINDRTFFLENPSISSITDVLVKYGSRYQYFIRTVAKIVMPQFDNSPGVGLMKLVSYYISSSPTTVVQFCNEEVPPPAPVDLSFVWNYKSKKLNVSWGMPPNTQRDIKQFQIFRRKSIYEPFELLRQQCFDFSSLKYTTGEKIDGNKLDMTQEEASYIDFQKLPSLSYIDEDFKVNSEDQTASRYIYAIASIDAHGFISNYSSQFEVSFDFYKNRITKKLISTQGAPRPYPNLLIQRDLFKDVIKTEGQSSMKMKVYFMPEYFKVGYKLNQQQRYIQRLVATKQQSGYYRMQIINLQNQKMETLNISIDDPYNLVNI